MRKVAAVFSEYGQVDEVVRSLEELGVHEHSVHISLPDPVRLNYFPKGYDPVGGARIFGDIMGTLPGNGRDLFGNSVAVDIELSKLPQLLEDVAGQEVEPQDTDYLVTVDCEDDQRSEEVVHLFASAGGQRVEVEEL